MNRQARIDSAMATNWVAKYEGKNVIKGYANWYGVDLICAIVELRLLGVSISHGRESQVRQSLSRNSRNRANRKMAEGQNPEGPHWDSDETFAYIAGYTSGGAPYGVTWEEMEETPPANDDEN
jgi:hypothetical protein